MSFTGALSLITWIESTIPFEYSLSLFIVSYFNSIVFSEADEEHPTTNAKILAHKIDLINIIVFDLIFV